MKIDNWQEATRVNGYLSGNLARGGDNSGFGGAFGGGIYNGMGLTTITNSTMNENLARGGDNAPGNYGEGGGIELNSPATSAVITGTTFGSNQAIGGNGGTGAYVGEGGGGAIANYGSASITGSTFNQNLAGGGSNGSSDPGSTDVDPGVDTSYGGAIDAGFYLDEASTTVAGSTFNYNQANGGNNGTATGTDIVEVGDAEGGAICTQQGLWPLFPIALSTTTRPAAATAIPPAAPWFMSARLWGGDQFVLWRLRCGD